MEVKTMNFLAFILMILAILAALFGGIDMPTGGVPTDPPTDPLPIGAECTVDADCLSNSCVYTFDPTTGDPGYFCN
ncbi:hypothetical protein GOV05_02620 [Candidatus Woesearchaeota archaeon]|nr:hypothetical protein [Candidatus Woesearchaeota archaeon]